MSDDGTMRALRFVGSPSNTLRLTATMKARSIDHCGQSDETCCGKISNRFMDITTEQTRAMVLRSVTRRA
jgi:hypothetical protein